MVDIGNLFGKLNLNNYFNIWIYIGGIILILSFVFTPIEIQNITSLRKSLLQIILWSVVGKELDRILSVYADAKIEEKKDNKTLTIYDVMTFLVISYFIKAIHLILFMIPVLQKIE